MAINFDGIDDYIDLGDRIVDDLTEVTVSAFIVCDDYSSNPMICGSSVASTEYYYFTLGIDSSGKLRMTFSDGTVASANATASNTTISTGVLYHVAATISISSGFNKVYLNGVEDGSEVITQTKVNIINNLFLGCRNHESPPTNGPLSYFMGSISDFKLYDRALSPNEIWTLSQSRIGLRNPIINNLIGHWVLDDLNGDKSNDTAIYFDGTNDYVNTQNTFGNDFVQGTICAWAKFDSSTTGTQHMIMGSSAGTPHRYLTMYKHTNERISCQFGDGGDTTVDGLSSLELIPFDRWFLCGVGWDGGSATLITNYVNGYYRTDNTLTESKVVVPSDFYIGCRNAGGPANLSKAKISDARLYNRVLSSDEFDRLRTAGPLNDIITDYSAQWKLNDLLPSGNLNGVTIQETVGATEAVGVANVGGGEGTRIRFDGWTFLDSSGSGRHGAGHNTDESTGQGTDQNLLSYLAYE